MHDPVMRGTALLVQIICLQAKADEKANYRNSYECERPLEMHDLAGCCTDVLIDCLTKVKHLITYIETYIITTTFFR